jgi:hypothetical protein
MMVGGGGVSQAQHYEVVFRLKSLVVAREEEVVVLKEELARAQEEVKGFEKRVCRWRKEGEEGGREGGIEEEEEEDQEEEEDEVLILWRRRVQEAESRRGEAERQLDESRLHWRRLLTQIDEEEEEVEEGGEGGREGGEKEEVTWGRMRGEYCQLLQLVKERAMG